MSVSNMKAAIEAQLYSFCLVDNKDIIKNIVHEAFQGRKDTDVLAISFELQKEVEVTKHNAKMA